MLLASLLFASSEKTCSQTKNNLESMYAGFIGNITVMGHEKFIGSSSLDFWRHVNAMKDLFGTLASLKQGVEGKGGFGEKSSGSWQHVKHQESWTSTADQVSSRTKNTDTIGRFTGKIIKATHTCSEKVGSFFPFFQSFNVILNELVDEFISRNRFNNKQLNQIRKGRSKLQFLADFLTKLKVDLHNADECMDKTRDLLKVAMEDQKLVWEQGTKASLVDVLTSFKPWYVLDYLNIKGDVPEAASYLEKIIEISVIHKTFFEQTITLPLITIEGLNIAKQNITPAVNSLQKSFRVSEKLLANVSVKNTHAEIKKFHGAFMSLVNEGTTLVANTKEQLEKDASDDDPEIISLTQQTTEWQRKALIFDAKLKRVIGDNKMKVISEVPSKPEELKRLASAHQLQAITAKIKHEAAILQRRRQFAEQDLSLVESRVLFRDLMAVDVDSFNEDNVWQHLAIMSEKIAEMEIQWLRMAIFLAYTKSSFPNLEKMQDFVEILKQNIQDLNSEVTHYPFAFDWEYTMGFEASSTYIMLQEVLDYAHSYYNIRNDPYADSVLISKTENEERILEVETSMATMKNLAMKETEERRVIFEKRLTDSFNQMCLPDPDKDDTLTEQVREALQIAENETPSLIEEIQDMTNLVIG